MIASSVAKCAMRQWDCGRSAYRVRNVIDFALRTKVQDDTLRDVNLGHRPSKMFLPKYAKYILMPHFLLLLVVFRYM